MPRRVYLVNAYYIAYDNYSLVYVYSGQLSRFWMDKLQSIYSKLLGHVIVSGPKQTQTEIKFQLKHVYACYDPLNCFLG